jgi:hypothetical protein
MKTLFFLLAMSMAATASAFSNIAEQASYYHSLFNSPNSATSISKSQFNKGETRPKEVLKGVFYFGGTDGKRTPLSSGYQELLCESGFSSAYAVYTKVNNTTSCGGNTLEYSFIGQAQESPNGGNRVEALMKNIYQIVKSAGSIGPIYLHCYYGVHASNTISQMVLKQFCGISDSTAFSNWDKNNIYNSLPAPGPANEKAKIAAFQPDANLQLTTAERSAVCF